MNHPTRKETPSGYDNVTKSGIAPAARGHESSIYHKLMYQFTRIQFLFTAVVVLAAVAVLGVLSFLRYQTRNQASVSQINERIRDLKGDVETCFHLEIKDVNVISDRYHMSDLSGTLHYAIHSEILEALEYYMVSFPEFSGMLYQDPEGELTTTGVLNGISAESLLPLFSQVPETGIPAAKELRIRDTAFEEQAGYPAWAVAHRVIDMDTGENLGMLLLTISMEAASARLPDETLSDTVGNFELAIGDGYVIGGAEKEDWYGPVWDRETFLTRAAKREQSSWFSFPYIYTIYPILEGDWLLLGRISVWDALHEGMLLGLLVLVLGGICIQLSHRTWRRIAGQITEPIGELTQTALKVREGHYARSHVQTADEIGVLAGVFNDMLGRIETLVENVRTTEHQKGIYEMELLQSQINPHFLYNTLDLIYIFCQTGDAAGGATIAKSLADFYRTSLSGGAQIVTVKAELDNISNYLRIQQERYVDILSYEIWVENIFFTYEIPKLTLQPIVENAIYHGIKPAGRPGRIRIDAAPEEDKVVLRIADDGVGMTKEEKDLALQALDTPEGGHFGLSSTHRRLQLYYGQACGLRIKSTEGEGTTVEVVIPVHGTRSDA